VAKARISTPQYPQKLQVSRLVSIREWSHISILQYSRAIRCQCKAFRALRLKRQIDRRMLAMSRTFEGIILLSEVLKRSAKTLPMRILRMREVEQLPLSVYFSPSPQVLLPHNAQPVSMVAAHMRNNLLYKGVSLSLIVEISTGLPIDHGTCCKLWPRVKGSHRTSREGRSKV